VATSCSWAGGVRIDSLTLALRPRLPYEAMDLGLRLLQAHWQRVYIALLVALLVPGNDTWLWPLVVWWLKPFYDRALLLVLSRAVFGQSVTAAEVLRAVPGFFKTGLMRALTWGRFDFARAFALPVWQLEGLKGKPRRHRVALLGKGARTHAVWLTVICIHLEYVVLFSLLALTYLLIPAELVPSGRELLQLTASDGWFMYLNRFAYLAAVCLIEPLYVASGFTLYLSRRTDLEGWDIELAFRMLAERLARETQKVAA
jgi:hypothetical protein